MHMKLTSTFVFDINQSKTEIETGFYFLTMIVAFRYWRFNSIFVRVTSTQQTLGYWSKLNGTYSSRKTYSWFVKYSFVFACLVLPCMVSPLACSITTRVLVKNGFGWPFFPIMRYHSCPPILSLMMPYCMTTSTNSDWKQIFFLSIFFVAFFKMTFKTRLGRPGAGFPESA